MLTHVVAVYWPLNMNDVKYESTGLLDTDMAGQRIGSALRFPACVHLNGEMGAGKTTLTKSIIRSLGYKGDVTSPTYNLIQEYQVDQGMVYHMDLYRLDDPAEIEYLAIEDLWSPTSIFLIEWAEKGEGCLPNASHTITIYKNTEQSELTRSILFQTP